MSKRFLKPSLVWCLASLDIQEATSKTLDTGKCVQDEQAMQVVPDLRCLEGEFGDILEVFATHDPTTLNRQGDVGTQCEARFIGTIHRKWDVEQAVERAQA